jgi:hypothetical protein
MDEARFRVTFDSKAIIADIENISAGLSLLQGLTNKHLTAICGCCDN